jgi:hypothetical protein
VHIRMVEWNSIRQFLFRVRNWKYFLNICLENVLASRVLHLFFFLVTGRFVGKCFSFFLCLGFE